MTVGKAAFIWGIRQQESGGNYSAGNPSGAEGAYQVLSSNITAWTKKALGHSVTASAFLDSPAIQDDVADTILGGYYDSYGPERAAAAWYSGDPGLVNSNAPQPGGPSVAQYVASVMGHAAQAPSGVTLPLSGSSASGSSSGSSGSATDTSSSGGGLLSFPSEITGFFSSGVDDLAATAKFFGAFTRVSTWVRIGSGAFGALFLIVGFVCLGLAAAKES